MESLSNCPWYFFTELEEIIQKFIQNHKKPLDLAGQTWGGKKKAGGITLADLRQYYKATVIKTVWYWYIKQTYRSMEQNREPRSKPRHLWSVSIQQRRQEYKMEKSLFSKWRWENWTAACKSMKLEHWKRLKHKTWCHKIARRQHRQNIQMFS